jgi:hypothetical protein
VVNAIRRPDPAQAQPESATEDQAEAVMVLSDHDLDECILSGQWRCTVEELQEAATRLLKEKRALKGSLDSTRRRLNEALDNPIFED